MNQRTTGIHHAARIALAFAAAATLAALPACSSSAPLFAADGRPTSQVQCSAAGPWDACWQNARGICGGPYDVVRESIDDNTRTLLFACNRK